MLYPSFVYSTKPNQLWGSTVYPAGAGLIAVDATTRNQFVANGQGVALDTAPGGLDLAMLNLAKIAAAYLTLTGTTPVTLDLTALAAATGVLVAGQSSFSVWNHILFTNLGSTALAISPGASNPLRTQLGGTSPTHTLQATDVLHWVATAGLAVDSTHKTITITPTAGGTLGIYFGGS